MTEDYPPEYGPVRPGDELDWDRLARYLRDSIDGLGQLMAVRQFPNGSANLTYLLEFTERRLVIRRPPFGQRDLSFARTSLKPCLCRSRAAQRKGGASAPPLGRSLEKGL